MRLRAEHHNFRIGKAENYGVTQPFNFRDFFVYDKERQQLSLELYVALEPANQLSCFQCENEPHDRAQNSRSPFA